MIGSAHVRENRFIRRRGKSIEDSTHDMKSIVFTNGQKVYRKSFLTSNVNQKFDEYNSSQISHVEQGNTQVKGKASSRSPGVRVLNSDNSRPRKIMNDVMPVMTRSPQKKSNIKGLLTQNGSFIDDDLDVVNFEKDLGNNGPKIEIKETVSMQNSMGNSMDDSSIIMKSDMTEDPLSRHSISPIRSNFIFITEKNIL
jgi:hypothetical protein